jgi:hypothetical protein
MKFKLMIVVACFCMMSIAHADMVLVLNNASYSSPRAIEYHFASSEVEILFDEGMACEGGGALEPGDGLKIRFGSQAFALQGEVLVDFSDTPVSIAMSTENGNLVCQFDRVFLDQFSAL